MEGTGGRVWEVREAEGGLVSLAEAAAAARWRGELWWGAGELPPPFMGSERTRGRTLPDSIKSRERKSR